MTSPLRLYLFAFAAVVLFTPARPCPCPPQLFSTAYYRSQETNIPFSVATVLSEHIRPIPEEQYDESEASIDEDEDSHMNLLAYEESELERVYKLRVIASHAECASPLPTVNVTTPYLSFDCGIKLALNTTYVLPLNQSGHTALNKCHTIVQLNALSAVQKQFLRTRQLCCQGVCRCVEGQLAKCVDVPCEATKPPCAEATICVNNYCDGCSADWFSKKSVPGCHPHV